MKRSIDEIKSVYANVDIYYMEGALDLSDGKNTFYNLLDKFCAAKLQGPHRLQKGLAFAAYNRTFIASDKQREVTIVPNCTHNIECVLASKEALSILFVK